MRAINIDELRAAAKRRLPRAIFEFIDGGAQDETTLRATREDFQKWRFRTRTLTDVSRRDQSVTLFGQHCASPLILAPTGLAGLLSRRGELAAARAADKYGVPYCLSTMSTCIIEKITRETAPPKWFQLYVALGPRITFKNFVGTKAASTDAVTITQFIAGQYDLSVSWRDVEWFKSAWGGPVLLKGILTAEDAALAVDHGADGVIVSNHGGRQLEGAMSASQALPEIAQAVGDKLEVILDGGIRRGADVVRARALGAKACMIGRAWLYGLGSGGQPGVERALEILRDEIDIALIPLGRPTLAPVDCRENASAHYPRRASSR